MKKILYLFGWALLLAGTFASCKENDLEAMRDKELELLDQYVKENNLADFKDPSGIYFKLLESSGDTTKIRKGFRLQLNHHITLVNDTVVFSTKDRLGHNYEDEDFYVEINDETVATSKLQRIAGMHIALKKMHIGDKALIVIPSQLAFKALNAEGDYAYIPRFSTLVATVHVRSGYLLPANN